MGGTNRLLCNKKRFNIVVIHHEFTVYGWCGYVGLQLTLTTFHLIFHLNKIEVMVFKLYLCFIARILKGFMFGSESNMGNRENELIY